VPQYRTCGDGAVIRRLVLDKQHAGTRSLVNIESQRLAVSFIYAHLSVLLLYAELSRQLVPLAEYEFSHSRKPGDRKV